MTRTSALTPDDFNRFFQAVHHHEPFPWQSRLANHVASTGWPAVLDLPTGSGKTAALDIAIFTLALSASAGVPTVPRRIVYVVDRRTIVDQAYYRARQIQRTLVDSQDHVVACVRNALAGCSREGLPLSVVSLRGGIAHDESWTRTPDQPVVAVSTVDQVGSRLLFRGYGIPDGMRPIHAGLLGNDVLYLLDEVHLSQPFKETLHAIGSRYRAWAERPLASPFVVVEMSATPSEPSQHSFRLEEEDRRHDILGRRLKAHKPVALTSTSPRNFIKEVEKRASAMLDRPAAAVGVIVNRVARAREIHSALHARFANSGAAVHLLTGRMRPFDRDEIDAVLLKRIAADRDRQAYNSGVVVVATQTIEAGADFDFDGLVTECASLDALRQRFGRLDRLGNLNGSAEGSIVARSDTLRDDPVYGSAIGETWTWLQARNADDLVGFGIEELAVPADAQRLGLLAPREHAPLMLPSHCDAWVQTSPCAAADPDIALWLHGPSRGTADVHVIWRADLDASVLQQAAVAGPDSDATAVVVDIVDALRPSAAEAMSVPFVAVKRWLQGESEAEVFDVEGASEVDEGETHTRQERPSRPALLWQGDESSVIEPKDLRPGQTIVVPASYGGIAHGNWAPEVETPVLDVGELAAWRSGRRAVMRLHPATTRTLFGDVDVPTPPSDDSEDADDRQLVMAWLDLRLSSGVEGELASLIRHLHTEYRRTRITRVLTGVARPPHYLVISGPARPRTTDADDMASPDDDEAVFTDQEITLSSHCEGVAAMAADFATRLGLPDDWVADLRLAGRWHDAGKADFRFQRWLHGGGEFKALVQQEPLAKGAKRGGRREIREARKRAGYPPGGRHEVTSLALMNAAGYQLTSEAKNWSRVQYLVVGHHGFCRPFAPWAPDPGPVAVTFNQGDITATASSAHGLERLDSGVADLFWQMVRSYGWWGIAWVEAIFRLADHRRSEIEEQRSEKRHA